MDQYSDFLKLEVVLAELEWVYKEAQFSMYTSRSIK